MTETDDERRSKGLPPAPRFSGDDVAPADPPKLVAASFWLWIVAGVVLIGGQVYSISVKQQIIDELIKANSEVKLKPGQKPIAPDMIASGTSTLLWVLLVGSVVFALLIGLFAYKMREGTRSARTVLTVLTVITVAFQLVIFYNLFSIAAAVLIVVAISLIHLPSVAGYFPKVGRKLP
ncbi:hypothetical protein [Amycolatopsis sp. CA-230715]|uniref:hypothetical protein n=1 Tax=Amycolatopsis sp. CA-230715 TaxID=2745196 RepID=UPI001C009C5A|nr:hypothetical protein [Amycolatopsis sp. CA-230715]QWF79890.1 hypothetical protein HUW46_03303 [Amycolatopsis sp. CA-230715]